MAGFSYLVSTPNEENENWQEEWFYLHDVLPEDRPQQGLTPFSLASPRKQYSWRPRAQAREGTSPVIRLVVQVACLRHHGLALINIMAVELARGIQPLHTARPSHVGIQRGR